MLSAGPGRNDDVFGSGREIINHKSRRRALRKSCPGKGPNDYGVTDIDGSIEIKVILEITGADRFACVISDLHGITHIYDTVPVRVTNQITDLNCACFSSGRLKSIRGSLSEAAQPVHSAAKAIRIRIVIGPARCRSC